VIAPSIALSYGVVRLPIAIGAALQFGRKDSVSNQTDHRVMLFISLDMPLFPLF